MTRRQLLVAPLLVAALAGCFHQVVQTGLAPGSKVVDKPFVSTWIFGLVPAQELDMRSECPGGIAIVTTEESFMNGLLSAITLGIWTPVHVMVTCASGTASLPAHALQVAISPTATASERAEAWRDAVRQSVELHESVVLRF